MQQLTKAHEDARAQLLAELQAAEADIKDAVMAVNTLIDERVNTAIEKYNEALSQVAGFRDEIVSRMDEFSGSQPKDWLETQDGSDFTFWMDDWDCLYLDSLPKVDPVDVPDMPYAQQVGALRSAASSG